MKNINLILENFVTNCQISMLEENEAVPGTHSELNLLKSKQIVQESAQNFRQILESGGLSAIQEAIALKVQPALEETDVLMEEFDAQIAQELMGTEPESVINPAAAAAAAAAAAGGGAALRYGGGSQGLKAGVNAIRNPNMSTVEAVNAAHNAGKTMAGYGSQKFNNDVNKVGQFAGGLKNRFVK